MVFMGMTPPIYEETGLARLPMMIRSKHLYAVMHESGPNPKANYHGLDPSLVASVPESLRNPLMIFRSASHPEDIVSVLELKDKEGRPIIVPMRSSIKGDYNHLRIDINLIKSIYGRSNFLNFFETAARQNHVLYINKKAASILPPEQQSLDNQDENDPINSNQAASVLPPGLQLPDHQNENGPINSNQESLETRLAALIKSDCDPQGFLTNTISAYRKDVNRNFQENQRLFSANYQQLLFNFDSPEEPEPGRKAPNFPGLRA
jgi:hypothetical protein